MATLVASSGFGANLVGDPGFETAGVWQVFGEAGRELWAPRSGNYGYVLRGWETNANGACWQDIALPALGTYTFTIYVRCESNFIPSTFQLKFEGYALDHGTRTEVDTIADWTSIPRDGLFHHLHVTKTFTNPATAFMRPVLYAAWNVCPNGQNAVMIDDAEVYVGVYTGVHRMANLGFEDARDWDWRGCSWAAYPESDWYVKDWAHRSGTYGVTLEGWEPAKSFFTRRASQPLTLLPTGTYTFSVWMHREADFSLGNAALRMEFFDITLTNKVQADVVTNFMVPNDSFWHKYYVVGTITSPAVYEMRPVIEVTWERTATGGARAMRIDDARFFAGTHDGYGVYSDLGYHGAVYEDPTLEWVPGTNVGPFLQVNDVARTNTFYILAKSPTVAKHTELGDGGKVGVRTAYQRPENGSWVENYIDGTKVGTMVIPAGGFRGRPVSDSVTVDLWRVQIPHPTNVAGQFYTTTNIYIFYTPYFKATNSGVDTELKFLVWRNGDRTNEWGQSFYDVFWGRDYGIDVIPLVLNDTFTNGGFENPIPATNSLDNTGWVGVGGANREQWAARTGESGAHFPTWDPGSAKLYQDTLTAGDAQEFSFWMRVQDGSNPTALEARIEWYNSDGVLVQVNRQNLMPFVKKGDFWTKVGVVGECNAPGLQRARYVIAGSYDDGTVPFNEAIHFDDAEVQEARTDLVNPGFEVGPKWFPEGWFVQPGQYDIGGSEPWANHGGTNGFALYGWNTNYYEGRLMQPVVVPGTGAYVFSIWIKREANFNLSNAALRLEWFSLTNSSKIQPDTVNVLTLPNDGQWWQYAVTGTCSVAQPFYVQVSFDFAFGPGSTDVCCQSLMVDDASFYATNIVISETDGIPNWWLQQYGLGLTNGVGAGDDDNDGMSNADEYAADTDPTNPNSWFRGPSSIGAVGGTGLIGVSSTSTGRYYFLEFKTNLLDSGPWLPYGTAVVGNGTQLFLISTNDAPQRFYRVGVRP